MERNLVRLLHPDLVLDGTLATLLMTLINGRGIRPRASPDRGEAGLFEPPHRGGALAPAQEDFPEP